MNRKDLGRSTDPRQERATTPTPCNPEGFGRRSFSPSLVRLSLSYAYHPARSSRDSLHIHKYIYRNARTHTRTLLYTYVYIYISMRGRSRARGSNPFCLPPPPDANASECPSAGGAPPHTPLVVDTRTRSIVEETVRSNRRGLLGSDTQTYTHTATARSSR